MEQTFLLAGLDFLKIGASFRFYLSLKRKQKLSCLSCADSSFSLAKDRNKGGKGCGVMMDNRDIIAQEIKGEST